MSRLRHRTQLDRSWSPHCLRWCSLPLLLQKRVPLCIAKRCVGKFIAPTRSSRFRSGIGIDIREWAELRLNFYLEHIHCHGNQPTVLHWLRKMPKKGKGKGKKKGKGDKKAAGPPPPAVQEEETINEDTRTFYLIQIKVRLSHDCALMFCSYIIGICINRRTLV